MCVKIFPVTVFLFYMMLWRFVLLRHLNAWKILWCCLLMLQLKVIISNVWQECNVYYNIIYSLCGWFYLLSKPALFLSLCKCVFHLIHDSFQILHITAWFHQNPISSTTTANLGYSTFCPIFYFSLLAMRLVLSHFTGK